MTQDSVNRDKFLDYVRGSLIPNMNPFDGISSKSIIIMDNYSVYHTQEVHDELQNAGVLVIFLPPYSPDYMPIELCFSYYLKSHMMTCYKVLVIPHQLLVVLFTV